MGRKKKTAPATSLSAYARHRGVSVEAVSKAVAAGRLPTAVVLVDGQPKIADVALADQEWEANTRPRIDQPRKPRRRSAADADADIDANADGDASQRYLEARARRESALADLAEIEVEEKLDELVPFEEARDYMIDKFTVAKTKLLGIPSRFVQQFPDLAEHAPAIESLLREAMEELAIDEDDGGDGEEEDEEDEEA